MLQVIAPQPTAQTTYLQFLGQSQPENKDIWQFKEYTFIKNNITKNKRVYSGES